MSAKNDYGTSGWQQYNWEQQRTWLRARIKKGDIAKATHKELENYLVHLAREPDRVKYDVEGETTRFRLLIQQLLTRTRTPRATRSVYRRTNPDHRMNIFIASSLAAKPQAKAFIRGCAREDVTFLPWWEQFRAGNTLLEELTRIRGQIDRAILILSPESNTTLRRHNQPIPNLNVLFEFGFFYSALGKDKVAVIRYGQVYLPSDLDGYIHITGSRRFTRGNAVEVGKETRAAFERWLKPPALANKLSADQVFPRIAAREREAKRLRE